MSTERGDDLPVGVRGDGTFEWAQSLHKGKAGGGTGGGADQLCG